MSAEAIYFDSDIIISGLKKAEDALRFLKIRFKDDAVFSKIICGENQYKVRCLGMLDGDTKRRIIDNIESFSLAWDIKKCR
jgi:hypothetical protein